MATVRTRKRGKTYSYIFEAGKKENGHRKVIEKGGYASKKEAYNAGVEAFNNFKHGNIGIISEKVSIEEFLNNWMNNVVKVNVKINSFINYMSILKTRVYPYIGDIAVQELTPIHVDTLMRTLLEKGYSYRSIVGARALLFSALSYAVYPAELISSNPIQYTKVPKSAPKNIIKRKIITKEDLKKIHSDSPYYIPCMILYHTGMRVSEVLGLRWRDIHNGVIHVTHQLKKAPQQIRFTTLKTESSYRNIPIDKELINILKEHHKKQDTYKLKDSYIVQYFDEEGYVCQASKVLVTDKNVINDFVCTRKNGKLVMYAPLNFYLNKLGLNAHSFRHTHTTMLVEAGAPLKGISNRLGHKKIAITQDIYTHVTDKMKNDTLSVFNTILDADK